MTNEERNALIVRMWNDGRPIGQIAYAARCKVKTAYQVVRRARIKDPSRVNRRYSGMEYKSMRYRQRLNGIGDRLVELFVSGDVDPCQNLTAENVAALLDISVVTVRKVASSGDLRSRKRNGRYVFELGDVAEWARSR